MKMVKLEVLHSDSMQSRRKKLPERCGRVGETSSAWDWGECFSLEKCFLFCHTRKCWTGSLYLKNLFFADFFQSEEVLILLDHINCAVGSLSYLAQIFEVASLHILRKGLWLVLWSLYVVGIWDHFTCCSLFHLWLYPFIRAVGFVLIVL